jgi:hypothetical protein
VTVRQEIEELFDRGMTPPGRWSGPDEVVGLCERLERLGRLDPGKPAGKCLCGKCGKVLCRLDAYIAVGPDYIWPVVQPISGRRPDLHTGQPRNPNPRRALPPKVAGPVDEGSGPMAGQDVWRLNCRCGRRYPVRIEKLTNVFVSALENGRNWIVVGRGPAALSHGGADL